MKKLLTLLSLVFVLVSCGTVTYSTIEMDQVYPASIEFPASLQKIGLVDRVNMSYVNVPSNPLCLDSKIFTEQLAKQLAEADYFEDIILCDSDVSLWERQEGDRLLPLSKSHVENLCDDLGVDMIVSTERSYSAPLKNALSPVILAETVLRLYVPERDRPLKTIALSDTIALDFYDSALSYGLIRNDIELYMAEKNAHYLAPYWTSVERTYFSGGNIDMRDAAMFVSQNNWEKAGELWNAGKEKAKGKLKEQFEFNLILYDEMTGNVEGAYKRCLEFQSRVASAYEDLSVFSGYYLLILKQRISDIQRLNLQLQRFQ